VHCSGAFWQAAPDAPGTPVSVINLADPWFSLPYNAVAFPFSANTANSSSISSSVQLNGSGTRCRGLSSCTANGSRACDGNETAGQHGSQVPPQPHGKETAGNGANPLHRLPVGDCSARGKATAGSEEAACSGAFRLHRPLVGGCSVALGDAHLLSCCAKLVYEDPARIRAVAARQAPASPVACTGLPPTAPSPIHAAALGTMSGGPECSHSSLSQLSRRDETMPGCSSRHALQLRSRVTAALKSWTPAC
jgi:hypothetical protein